MLDWIPFLFIFLSYEFLRGLTPFVNPRADFLTAINFDSTFFGQIPTISLQNLLFNPNNINLLDYLSAMFYFLHLALPYAFGYILWILSREHFRRFSTGIIFLSYAGWLTFVLFPAAPPWLAAQHGYIPHVYRVMDYVTKSFPDRLHLPSIYHDFYPNNVAAIPSMHAAYPFLVFLFGLKYFKAKFAWFGLYVLGVWFSIVYLGEHYVLDIVVGAVYALGSYFLTEWLFKNKENIFRLARKLKFR